MATQITLSLDAPVSDLQKQWSQWPQRVLKSHEIIVIDHPVVFQYKLGDMILEFPETRFISFDVYIGRIGGIRISPQTEYLRLAAATECARKVIRDIELTQKFYRVGDLVAVDAIQQHPRLKERDPEVRIDIGRWRAGAIELDLWLERIYSEEGVRGGFGYESGDFLVTATLSNDELRRSLKREVDYSELIARARRNRA